MVARVLVHLRGERAGRDGADHDALGRQAQGHALGQVDQAGLAGRVGVGLPGVDRDAVDGGDIDDLGQLRACGRLAQHGRERLGQEEGRLHVQVHDLVPAAFGKFVIGRAPGRARVVDEDAQLVFVRRISIDQRLHAVHGGHVGGQRNAVAQLRQLARRLVAGLGLARRDVHARALAHKAFGDHAADTARTTGDKSRAALERKHLLGIHGAVSLMVLKTAPAYARPATPGVA